jgi:VanZ family protein
MGRRPPERRFFVLFLQFWLPVLVYVTVIIVLSAQPNLRPPLEFRNSDKFYHGVEYFGLGVLLVRAVSASLRLAVPAHAALVSLCLGILVGTADEMFQSTVPGRVSSGVDLFADTLGVAIAQLAWLALGRR